MAVKERIFGTDATGRTAHLFTLTNRAGVSATFTDLGAAWVGMELPAEGGKTVDVILGYDDPAIYERNPGCLGAIVGRHANRIAGAGFTLDGRSCQLEKNQGENNLHSGPDGWWKRLFRAEVLEEENAVRFSIEEPDGAQGFPGALSFSVTYGLTEENAVEIHYAGTLTAGAAHTVFNPTNHAYFNLAGHDAGEIDAQEVWIHADYFTPTDAVSIQGLRRAGAPGRGSLRSGERQALRSLHRPPGTPVLYGELARREHANRQGRRGLPKARRLLF